MSANSGGFGRSVRAGAVAGVVILVLAAIAVALSPGILDREPEPADVFAFIVAGPGEDGITGARIIAEVDLRGAELVMSVKDPSARAEIVGTSYDHVSDAYAFGGGGAVVEAAYSAKVPYVAVDAETFAELVDDAGGLEIDIPEDMDVFTGGELISFRQGKRTLGGEEAMWVLSGADYLGPRAEKRLRDQVAEEALRAVSSARGGLAGLVERGQIQSDIDSRALPTLAVR